MAGADAEQGAEGDMPSSAAVVGGVVVEDGMASLPAGTMASTGLRMSSSRGSRAKQWPITDRRGRLPLHTMWSWRTGDDHRSSFRSEFSSSTGRLRAASA
jgi:hypothetical protein